MTGNINEKKKMGKKNASHKSTFSKKSSRRGRILKNHSMRLHINDSLSQIENNKKQTKALTKLQQ